RGIRAARDRGDDDGAVIEAFHAGDGGRGRGGGDRRRGGGGRGRLGMRLDFGRVRRFARLVLRRFRLALREHQLERLLELQLRLFQRHAVLRTLGSREAGLHRRKIQLDALRVGGVGRRGGAEETLRLRV